MFSISFNYKRAKSVICRVEIRTFSKINMLNTYHPCIFAPKKYSKHLDNRKILKIESCERLFLKSNMFVSMYIIWNVAEISIWIRRINRIFLIFFNWFHISFMVHQQYDRLCIQNEIQVKIGGENLNRNLFGTHS